MKTVTIHHAKTHLSQLIEKAKAGEDVIISKGKTPVAKIVALNPLKIERKFGSLKGKIKLDDSFFDPLPDDELSLWEQ